MKLEPLRDEAPAGEVVDTFLRTLLAGRLQAAARMITPDMVFLGRVGWHGEATPFREDARLQAGSLRQLPREEVAAISPERQVAAFETEIRSDEYVFFAIIRTATSRATLGIIAREVDEGYAIARLFDTRRVREVLLSDA